MANRHLAVGYDNNYRCHRRKHVCSLDNRTCRRECYQRRNPEEYTRENPANQEPTLYDNMDVINDMYGHDMSTKLAPLDERLAEFAKRSGKKNQRAIEGAVRATREQFQCHFTDELEEHYQRRWWDKAEYPVDESNWWDRLDYYQTNYDSY